MEDGVVNEVNEGTPQGGLVSPALANIYLHYVLDLWFERRYKKSCRGKAFLVRYCDDFIACFQHGDEARRFHRELGERLAAFALEAEPSKTAVLRFGTQATRDCHRDGLRRPQTFSFLGLTHYVSRSRRGRFVDFLFMTNLVGGTGTSLGLATPMIAARSTARAMSHHRIRFPERSRARPRRAPPRSSS